MIGFDSFYVPIWYITYLLQKHALFLVNNGANRSPDSAEGH